MISVSKQRFAIGAATVRRAETQVLSCEACEVNAHTRFERVLDRVACRQNGTTDYLLTRIPRCPQCSGPLFQDTLVELGVGWYVQ